MERAFIGVGSNIDPERNVREALKRLSSIVRVKGISTVYSTNPIGVKGAMFYNCIIAIETDLSPFELKDSLKSIEDGLGRIRGADKYAPRTIDLDIVIYGSMVLDERGLKIPDPDILTRAFLAIPLKELSPGLIVPGTGKSVEDLAEALGAQGMEALKGFTEKLRKEIPA